MLPQKKGIYGQGEESEGQKGGERRARSTDSPARRTLASALASSQESLIVFILGDFRMLRTFAPPPTLSLSLSLFASLSLFFSSLVDVSPLLGLPHPHPLHGAPHSHFNPTIFLTHSCLSSRRHRATLSFSLSVLRNNDINDRKRARRDLSSCTPLLLFPLPLSLWLLFSSFDFSFFLFKFFFGASTHSYWYILSLSLSPAVSSTSPASPALRCCPFSVPCLSVSLSLVLTHIQRRAGAPTDSTDQERERQSKQPSLFFFAVILARPRRRYPFALFRCVFCFSCVCVWEGPLSAFFFAVQLPPFFCVCSCSDGSKVVSCVFF